jgi:hypothetical protein
MVAGSDDTPDALYSSHGGTGNGLMNDPARIAAISWAS